ncbi:collagenase [Streptomyces hypolithicus]
MSYTRTVRKGLLVAALSASLTLPMIQAAQSAPAAPAGIDAQQVPATFQAGPRAGATDTPTANPFDEVERLAEASKTAPTQAPAPGGGLLVTGRVPGDMSVKPGAKVPAVTNQAPSQRALAGTVPCTLDGITGLSPTAFANFLADTYAVSVDGCLRNILWTWDARLAPVMSDAHVQAVAKRITQLAPKHSGTNSTNLYEMFTYLHAVAYHDYSRDEIDTSDATTTAAVTAAVTAFGKAARTFGNTPTNGYTLREALYAASGPGLRQHHLGLIQKVLATMAPGTATFADPAWGAAVLGALSVNYLGVYPGNTDDDFHAAAGADAEYRKAFRVFATYSHLKGTPNAWAARDAMGEYGRFGEIDAIKASIITDLGDVLTLTETHFGKFTAPWASIVGWLNYYGECERFNVCKAQIEAQLFTNTFTYDNGAIKVRTALSRETVDQLYYASKRVKTQFHRVIGSDKPLAGDTNTTLNIHLYATRSDYEVYHPLLTGYPTNNGGIYIEKGATFYTYQRTAQESTLTLEELFRHEYTHYLNGRFAVPGTFGQGDWYRDDRTTAMDEGTAEFFDGATRDNGIAVRKSLVRSIINDTAGGGPRMSVQELLHAEYDRDGFRFYSYAGTFFEFLWAEHPSELRTMYGFLRANDPAGFDAWRNRLGADTAFQAQYDTFLDAQIAKVDSLYIPNTTFTPNGSLKFATADEVKSAFTSATAYTPVCNDNADWNNKVRFTCTGRITATLTDSNNSDKVFKDMSETVDYFILDRSATAGNNLADMNCSFSPVDIWSNGQAGSSDYVCEGPLRR